MPLSSFLTRHAPACLRPARDEDPDPHRPSATRGAASDALAAWRYDQGRYGPPAAFGLHPDFQRFSAHVGALTQALSAVVQDEADAVDHLNAFLKRLTTLDANGNNRAFGQYADKVYTQGVELLDQLARLIRDPRIDKGQARAEIQELSRTLAQCSVAVIDGLSSSLRRLSPPPRALPAKWHALQLALIEQSAAETLDLSDLATTNRHSINALLPVLYKDAGLKDRLPDDPYATKDLPKSVVEEARRQLAEDLHPASVSMVMADEYLSRLGAVIRQEDAGAPAGLPLTVEKMENAIAKLSAEFGSKPALSEAFRADQDDGSCTVATDVTLLAAHFLDCWRSQLATRKQDRATRPLRIGTSPDGTALLRTGRLAWAESGGVRRLLELADLPALKPANLPACAFASMVRRSAPDDLWTTLPAEWMRSGEAFEALLDRIDDVTLRACFDRWQRSSTPLNEDQRKLLAMTVCHCGRGSALFEGATLAWQRLIVPELHDTDSLRSLYRELQSAKLTSSAFNERLAAAWRASQSVDLPDAMLVSMPGASFGKRHEACSQFATQWLGAAAEALSCDSPQVTIEEITHAIASSAPDSLWHVAFDTISALRKNQLEWGVGQPVQHFRPEHAKAIVHAVLQVDTAGRSGLLQEFWKESNEHSFFKLLETTLHALVEHGCQWSELTAFLSLEGQPTEPKMTDRLEYARAFIRTLAYPDGPVERTALPDKFTVIPTTRKAFRDVGVQHDGAEAEAQA